MTKNKIDSFLEKELSDSNGKFDQLFTHEDKYLIETKIIEKEKFTQEVIPDQMIFKRNKVNLILITLFLVCGLCSAGIAFLLNGKGVFPALVLNCLGILLGIYIWFIKPNDKLILNKNGIQFNDDLYKWRDILSIHIIYIDRSGDHKSYLILELRNDRVKKLEISNINFSNFFKDNSSDDEFILGHYIEKYKIELTSPK